MKEQELIAGVLKRRPGAERAMAYLEDEQKVQYALEEIGEVTSEDPVDYLVKEIDRMWAASPDSPTAGMPKGGGGPQLTTFEYLEDHERERMEVRARVLAKHATADESVLAFRQRFLGDQLLTSEQTQAFVTSLANQNLPVWWFDEHGVSFLDHTTHTQRHSVDYRGEMVEFTVQPAAIECRVKKDSLSEDYGTGEMLSVAGESGYWRGFTGYVRTDSPLGTLRDLGEHLTKRYRGWQSNDATRFVLTGEPPKESPLWQERGSGGEIVLHVAPWISPSSVERTYRQAVWSRGWMNERYGKGHAAKSVRRISDKNLKLLRFITDMIDLRGQLPTGREAVGEWDKAYPKWAYRGDTRTMWRDYNRTLRSVAPTIARKRNDGSG